MKYFLFAMHGYLELFKKRGQKTLFEYTKKNNFELFMENGKWGFVLLDRAIEKSYFEFLSGESEFPGEGFLRALKYNIPAEENKTFFLGKFVSMIDEKIVEIEINLNYNEKKSLLEEIKKEVEDVEIFIFGDEIILKISEGLTKIFNEFPNKIKGKSLSEVLFKNREMEKINDFMLNSFKKLNFHPVNKVRGDLNEPVANFLYLYGMGKYMDRVKLSEKLKKKIFYYSDSDKLNGLYNFFELEKMEKISEFEEDCLYWFDFSLDYKLPPSIWVKKFENFTSDILKEINFSEDKKFLFIFDPFFNPDYEYEKNYSLFLAVNFNTKLKKKYKNSYLLFKEFIEK
jgi:2,3-bisphosphoglycerate-independent phosphoglycerate mutase